MQKGESHPSTIQEKEILKTFNKSRSALPLDLSKVLCVCSPSAGLVVKKSANFQAQPPQPTSYTIVDDKSGTGIGRISLSPEYADLSPEDWQSNCKFLDLASRSFRSRTYQNGRPMTSGKQFAVPDLTVFDACSQRWQWAIPYSPDL
jgi:hypothetical protein